MHHKMASSLKYALQARLTEVLQATLHNTTNPLSKWKFKQSKSNHPLNKLTVDALTGTGRICIAGYVDHITVWIKLFLLTKNGLKESCKFPVRFLTIKLFNVSNNPLVSNYNLQCQER